MTAKSLKEILNKIPDNFEIWIDQKFDDTGGVLNPVERYEIERRENRVCLVGKNYLPGKCREYL